MKKYLSILLLVLFMPALAAAEDSAVRYYIPPPQFNAALEIMDLGFSNVFGMFRNATGSFEFDAKEKSVSNLKLAIDASSLMAGNPANENDLIGLFAASQYPEIVFVAKDNASFTDNKADIKGTLTLRGVSKPFTLSATLNHIGKSPHGGGMWNEEGEAVGFSMQGAFKRADFGMADDPNMPARFGDTVTLRLETQAIRQ